MCCAPGLPHSAPSCSLSTPLLLPYCSPTAPLLLPYCSFAAPSKAALLPFPIENDNFQFYVRGVYNIYIYSSPKLRLEYNLSLTEVPPLCSRAKAFFVSPPPCLLPHAPSLLPCAPSLLPYTPSLLLCASPLLSCVPPQPVPIASLVLDPDQREADCFLWCLFRS
jgi:hypothetical protein